MGSVVAILNEKRKKKVFHVETISVDSHEHIDSCGCGEREERDESMLGSTSFYRRWTVDIYGLYFQTCCLDRSIIHTC